MSNKSEIHVWISAYYSVNIQGGTSNVIRGALKLLKLYEIDDLDYSVIQTYKIKLKFIPLSSIELIHQEALIVNKLREHYELV